jgi:hypothetical protein
MRAGNSAMRQNYSRISIAGPHVRQGPKIPPHRKTRRRQAGTGDRDRRRGPRHRAAHAVGIACGAVMCGYAAPEALRALEPDMLFERMEDIAVSLLE